MSERGHSLSDVGIAFLFAVSAQACTGARVVNATPSAEALTATAIPSTTVASTARPLPATNGPIATIESITPVAARVRVTAKKGNVFVRRGPDFAFNDIGVLFDGQSATALARDVLAEWVEVPLPGQANQTGWISIQSQYTLVDGDVMTLPEVEPTYYPVAASLRNCTLHQMLITPGNIILPSLDNFPANEVRVNPGAYVVLDTDVDGYPQVLKVEVREGSSTEVRVDGDGEKRKCPVP